MVGGGVVFGEGTEGGKKGFWVGREEVAQQQKMPADAQSLVLTR